MHVEILILGWGCVLLMVHVFVAGHFKTRQYGVEWNTGPRDEQLPPLDKVAGRLVRAQANYLETFPVAVAALLGVVVAGRTGTTTALGGWLWLAARVVYLPLYWSGIRLVRSLVFLVSLVGLVLVLWPLLLP